MVFLLQSFFTLFLKRSHFFNLFASVLGTGVQLIDQSIPWNGWTKVYAVLIYIGVTLYILLQ